MALVVNDQLHVLAGLTARKEIWMTSGQIRVGAMASVVASSQQQVTSNQQSATSSQ